MASSRDVAGAVSSNAVVERLALGTFHLRAKLEVADVGTSIAPAVIEELAVLGVLVVGPGGLKSPRSLKNSQSTEENLRALNSGKVRGRRGRDS